MVFLIFLGKFYLCNLDYVIFLCKKDLFIWLNLWLILNVIKNYIIFLLGNLFFL